MCVQAKLLVDFSLLPNSKSALPALIEALETETFGGRILGTLLKNTYDELTKNGTGETETL